MTVLEQLCKATGHHLEVWESEGKFHIELENSWILDGPMKVGEYGVGSTVELAALDYVQKISGKRIQCCGKEYGVIILTQTVPMKETQIINDIGAEIKI